MGFMATVLCWGISEMLFLTVDARVVAKSTTGREIYSGAKPKGGREFPGSFAWNCPSNGEFYSFTKLVPGPA
jgi:hypothetical protein